MNRLQQLIMTSRPISWVNTAYPFAATYIVAGGKIDAFFWVAVVYFLFPYNLLMYGVNDVFDYESDMKNPRKGGVEGIVLARRNHTAVLAAAVCTNVPFWLYALSVGSVLSHATLALIVFFVIAYSAPKLRYKERPFLDSLTSSMHFVGPMLYALTLTQVTAHAWWYVASFLRGEWRATLLARCKILFPIGKLRSVRSQQYSALGEPCGWRLGCICVRRRCS